MKRAVCAMFVAMGFCLCVGSLPVMGQKKKAKPRPNEVYELRNDMPVFLDQLKEELTYPLAWENSGMRFKKWRKTARAKLEECMMTPPRRAEKWDMEVVATERRQGYEVKKIKFNLTDYSRVPAYLCVPDGEGPHPAVVLMHDHGAHFTIGKEKMVRPFGVDSLVLQDADQWAHGCYDDQYVGDYLASRGYVVLTLDALFWGERGRKEGADYEGQQVIACVFQQLGRSWSGSTTFEDAYSAEFLASLPEVDSERIGAMGFSMGAYRTWMLTAFTDRVKAGAAVCWMTTTDYQLHWDYRKGKGGSDFANTLPMIRQYMDYPHIASIACPKPMLFFNGRQDKLFPVIAVEKAYGQIRSVYESQGASDKLVTKLWDLPHFCSKEIQQEVADWLDKVL